VLLVTGATLDFCLISTRVPRLFITARAWNGSVRTSRRKELMNTGNFICKLFDSNITFVYVNEGTWVKCLRLHVCRHRIQYSLNVIFRSTHAGNQHSSVLFQGSRIPTWQPLNFRAGRAHLVQ
jgi:hypothetical protein